MGRAIWPRHGRIVNHHAGWDSYKGFEASMFSFVPSFTPEKTSIYGIQRKVLAIKWFTKGSCQRHSWAKFWIHRGLCNPSQNIFTRDGIHLNAAGHQALYRSYRGFFLFALNWKRDSHEPKAKLLGLVFHSRSQLCYSMLVNLGQTKPDLMYMFKILLPSVINEMWLIFLTLLWPWPWYCACVPQDYVLYC